MEQTLNGSAGQIKERTIGVEVFGREPTYDTNVDHIVRTAATELRKRLAIYYGDEKHRSELRMGLIPGSYIPRFGPPLNTAHPGQMAVSDGRSPAQNHLRAHRCRARTRNLTGNEAHTRGVIARARFGSASVAPLL